MLMMMTEHFQLDSSFSSSSLSLSLYRRALRINLAAIIFFFSLSLSLSSFALYVVQRWIQLRCWKNG